MTRKTQKNQALKKSPEKNTVTSRQVVAIVGVVLLVLLYIATLLLAIFDNSSTGKFFMLSICCTLVIPIIVFLYSWMYARLTGKKLMGDPENVYPDQNRSASEHSGE